MIYGLLCDHDGRPVAVECFDGSLHDDKTLGAQIAKLKTRFQISRVTVVIDRGFATKANVQLLSETDGVAWITALKAPQVKKLVKDGVLQLSLFDEHNLAEIACEQLYPGERLVVCRNPLVAAERTRKRDSLLDATERTLSEIAERVRNKTLAGEAVWTRWSAGAGTVLRRPVGAAATPRQSLPPTRYIKPGAGAPRPPHSRRGVIPRPHPRDRA